MSELKLRPPKRLFLPRFAQRTFEARGNSTFNRPSSAKGKNAGLKYPALRLNLRRAGEWRSKRFQTFYGSMVGPAEIEERFLDCVSRRFAQEQKGGTLRSE